MEIKPILLRMDDKWLNQQFKNNPDKTKGDLSNVLGIQPSGISKMLAGTRQIKAKEYLLMRKFFDIPGSGQALAKSARGIQEYAHIRAEDVARQQWKGKNNGPQYSIVEVSDAAMLPDFLPGERLLVDLSSIMVDKSGIFALEEQEKIIIRIVENADQKLKISAISKDVQPRTLPQGKIQIIGRVIAKLNWL